MPSRKLVVLDIKRAFLLGMATRNIYIELPAEDSQGRKHVGKQIRAFFGTRDAPLAWQRVGKEDVSGLGFLESKSTSGVFTQMDRDLKVVTHVDDFLVSAEMRDLSWLSGELARKYELKVEIAGWEQGDLREIRFLGRPIRTTHSG